MFRRSADLFQWRCAAVAVPTLIAALSAVLCAGLFSDSESFAAALGRRVGASLFTDFTELRRFVRDCQRSRAERLARPRRWRLRLLLVRHGQSLANLRPELIAGRDVSCELSARGEAQARALGERLARDFKPQPNVDRVIASHARRARRTAEIACSCLGFPLERIEEEPRVVEFSQGSLEKLPRREVYQEGGQVLRAIDREAMFFRPPGTSPDGDRGESQYDVELRFASFAEELLAEATEPLTVLVFSHGIAIRSFLRGVLGASAQFVVHAETDNTSITELEYSPERSGRHSLGGWSLRRFNDAGHLRSLVSQ